MEPLIKETYFFSPVFKVTFKNCLVRYLLTDQNRLRSVNDIMPMIGARFYTQLDAAQMRNDVIEEDLAKVNAKIVHIHLYFLREADIAKRFPKSVNVVRLRPAILP